jgi:hypothetical protein
MPVLYPGTRGITRQRGIVQVSTDKTALVVENSMLDTYGHVMTDEKIAAQGSMLERIMPKTNAMQ